MKALGVYTSLLLVLGCFGEVDEHMESSLVKKLTATCSKDGIKVNVRFNHPFTGIVYSYGHYDTAKCVFVDNNNNVAVSSPETRFSFIIPADECGTVFHDPGSTIQDNSTGVATETDNEVYMENTVMFQKSHYIQEQGDLAQTLRCVWQKEIRKPLYATLPFRRKQVHKIQREDAENTTAESKPTQSSYKENTSGRYQSPVKRFQGKGQVESISFGRRRGKSMEYTSVVEVQDSRILNLPNLTALAFKADETSGAYTMVSCTKGFIMCNYVLVVIITNIFFSYFL
ncbi:hypothetical protein Ocin01_04671 [Orchesella cincta]|uniref:ZP domain-containing protein n=1 Tax=Orchesella cincta TaxID=48709 RepID=A0A1D2N9T4_ORCCI|nr:hypothetical protein Ocin01_04671 [Orchesella cincta]